MEPSPFVQVQGGGFAILKNDQVMSVAGRSAVMNKDNCVQLVLDTGPDNRQVNILEYLKTEILDDKRPEQRLTVSDKENGSVIPSMFEKDIALKIEVMEEGIGRTITVPQEQLAKISVLNPVRKKKKKAKDKLLRPKNYMCGECGIGFVSSKDLNRHRVVHTGEKPYNCPYCDQKFTAPSSRATHIRSIHEKSQEFPCPQCEKPFNQKSNMIKHYKTIHLETVVIICQECGREFNQASALRRHVKIVHKKELPHVCQCGKRFALAESLKKHMEAIHLKSRAYPCTYCDYAASRADMLKIHIRKIHTKEWSYKCALCENKGTPWGCILPKELRRHLQTRHPGEYQVQEVEERIKDPGEKRMKNVVVETNVGVVKETGGDVGVEERAQEILNTIRHPLEFSVQLEQEVRARACRAPASVLATNREPSLQVNKHHHHQQQQQAVVLEPVVGGAWGGGGGGGTVYTGQVYRQLQYPGGPGDQAGTTRWQLLQDTEQEAGTVLRYYDYQRQ